MPGNLNTSVNKYVPIIFWSPSIQASLPPSLPTTNQSICISHFLKSPINIRIMRSLSTFNTWFSTNIISDRVHCNPLSLMASESRCHTAYYLKETKDAEVSEPCSMLGCAFRQNSARFQWKWDKSHRPEWNVNETSIEMCYSTILDIRVHSGWYLSTRFLHVEKTRTYSK